MRTVSQGISSVTAEGAYATLTEELFVLLFVALQLCALLPGGIAACGGGIQHSHPKAGGSNLGRPTAATVHLSRPRSFMPAKLEYFEKTN